MKTMKQWCKTLNLRPYSSARRAGAFLESKGKRFRVDFGTDNAESVARSKYDFRADVSIKTLNGRVLRFLRIRNSGWWTPAELISKYLTEYGVMVSDSSITARIRDLRKPRYGAHVIEKRRREGSNAYEYRLKKSGD